MVGTAVGRKWDFFELYLGTKHLVLVPLGYVINTAKVGVRFTVWNHFIAGLEGGATFHHNFLVLGEGAVHLGFKL
jgi:hypothetical protein